MSEDMAKLREQMAELGQAIIDTAPRWLRPSLEGWRIIYRRLLG